MGNTLRTDIGTFISSLRDGMGLAARGYDALGDAPLLPGPARGASRTLSSSLPLPPAGSVHVRHLDSEGLDVRQILLSSTSTLIPEQLRQGYEIDSQIAYPGPAPMPIAFFKTHAVNLI